ncbi:dienelactone hydrolase family protein [Mucilaginibacter sp. L3T2-6]|uniref:dienelactone hydrolase family protein n=1 Tax=Mucilaginibacter sp. L3T2-6 TaxID=3062491 RepID=UPI002675ABA5|nr:alpha/beta family hydrolase [Mucilaginibacter sp. L3T2-6]MDO3644368.1 dienelactone hydrolase family protein [Mucilaginibacter sp. L3T2-6]MDV6216820.1 alpha/beta family hydrolase [Mucilaginibacter sp. L3T2-6]
MDNSFHNKVTIPVDGIHLAGDLMVPHEARAVVVFAHGSGSSRLSPRNQQVARQLQENNFATLLFDLLTPEEDKYYRNRFAINLLTERLVAATRWLEGLPAVKHLRIAYFGASTGAAAALKAAAELPEIFAVVSRGGRADLAMPDLSGVKAPTLLIVGGNDTSVEQLNRAALRELGGVKKLEIVPGASHLFEEPGKLTTVAALATEWFKSYLPVLSGYKH